MIINSRSFRPIANVRPAPLGNRGIRRRKVPKYGSMPRDYGLGSTPVGVFKGVKNKIKRPVKQNLEPLF